MLHLVETGELDDRGDAPHKLCLVAVTHHNIAVEQLLLHHVEEAVVSARGRAPVRSFVPSTPRGPTRARERARPIEAVRRRARGRRFFLPAQAQNARRLARLCLSYSNRWLDKFESTHRCAAEALSAMGGGLAEGLDKARGRGKGGRGEGGRLTLTHGAAPKERRKTVMIAAG